MYNSFDGKLPSKLKKNVLYVNFNFPQFISHPLDIATSFLFKILSLMLDGFYTSSIYVGNYRIR